jgi:hypothetical protein
MVFPYEVLVRQQYGNNTCVERIVTHCLESTPYRHCGEGDGVP